MNAKEHYNNLLGDVYSWMIGDFRTAVEEQKTYFSSHNIITDTDSIAFDLGCGNGIQSVALSELGFNVYAFDFNRKLLSDLKCNIGNKNIYPVESDLLEFDKHINLIPALITCMGDTVTHFNSFSEIDTLLSMSSRSLNSGGKMIISFRDLSVPLHGTERFIPVRSDSERIMTCFLEFNDNFVTVNDLIHEKKDNVWIQKISAYKKLRISAEAMKSALQNSGFKIISEEIIKRMIYIIAERL